MFVSALRVRINTELTAVNKTMRNFLLKRTKGNGYPMSNEEQITRTEAIF